MLQVSLRTSGDLFVFTPYGICACAPIPLKLPVQQALSMMALLFLGGDYVH